MAIRVAHGITPALSGAAGFLADRDREADRRGAAAAGALNQSLALKQRQREFEFNAAMELAKLGGGPGGGGNRGSLSSKTGAGGGGMPSRGGYGADGEAYKKPTGRPQAIGQPQVRERGTDGQMQVVDPRALAGGGAANAAAQNWIQQAMQQAGPGPAVYSKEQAQWQVESARMLDQQAAAMQEGLSQEGLADLNRIQANRAQMTPQQYSQVMGQFFERYQQPGAQQWQPQTPAYSPDAPPSEQASQINAEMSKANLTPEGRRIYGDLSGKLRAIESQRENLRPEQYDQLMQRWVGDYEKAGLQQYMKEPPKIQQEMEGRFMDFGTGYGAFLQPDGKIDVREIDPVMAAQAKGMGMQSAAPGDLSPMQDRTTRDAYKKKALEDLRRTAAEEANANVQAGGDAARPRTDFTPEEITDRAFKLFDADQKIEALMDQRLAPANAPAAGAAGQGQAMQPQAMQPPQRMLFGELLGGTRDPNGVPMFQPPVRLAPPKTVDPMAPDRGEMLGTRIDYAKAMQPPVEQVQPQQAQQPGVSDTVSPTPMAMQQPTPEMVEAAKRKSIQQEVDVLRETSKPIQEIERLMFWNRGKPVFFDSLIEPDTIDYLRSQGSQFPIEDAAKMMVEAFRTGAQNINLMDSMTRQGMKLAFPLVTDESDEALDKMGIRPGDKYRDGLGNIKKRTRPEQEPRQVEERRRLSEMLQNPARTPMGPKM